MQPRFQVHEKEEQWPSWAWVLFSQVKSFKSKEKDNVVLGFLTMSMEVKGVITCNLEHAQVTLW